jgi:metal-dependent hydrolase (beta-lactamase superfamily II)
MHYEIDFLPVGDSNGDAICLRYGNDDGFSIHVVDGGFTDTAETMIHHIRSHYGAHVFINHMVLSHADNDHTCGLVGRPQGDGREEPLDEPAVALRRRNHP